MHCFYIHVCMYMQIYFPKINAVFSHRFMHKIRQHVEADSCKFHFFLQATASMVNVLGMQDNNCLVVSYNV